VTERLARAIARHSALLCDSRRQCAGDGPTSIGVGLGTTSTWRDFARAKQRLHYGYFTLLCRANCRIETLIHRAIGAIRMLMKYKLSMCAALAVTLTIGGLVDRSVGQSAPAPQIGAWGFDVNGVDAQAKPGDSFFDYANGAWAARTVIPPDKARFGMFDALRDKTEDQVHTIIIAAAKSGASPATDDGKIGALYNAFMDEAR